jgi:subtilisin family serine protease
MRFYAGNELDFSREFLYFPLQNPREMQNRTSHTGLRSHQTKGECMLRRSGLFFLTSFLFTATIISYSPRTFAQNAATSGSPKVWIFFRDKGPQGSAKNSAAFHKAAAALSPRALQRRAKVLPQNALIEITDLEICPAYLDELARMGLRPIVRSRWLNAVSVEASREQVQALQKLPFVTGVQAVARLRVPPPVPTAVPNSQLSKANAVHRFAYGASLAQMEQIGAANLHDAGITGRGVLVGMMDSGFRWQDHEAFDRLAVVSEFDFVKNDGVTRNEPGDPAGQDSHGTGTLSTIAGFQPGELIGPAFESQFLLAKTENIASETHAEEDFWAAAIEWMETQGVDLTSTSLGYNTFDTGQSSYTQAQMDGNTAIITKAAEIAASKGVIVVNSAGNEGDGSWRIITAPADGPNVIAVGAVASNGGLVGFSSRGPTADGRFKPDVMAMGLGVRTVVSSSQSDYTFSAGTSFSCPLVAGVVAQILSAHPELTPQQVLNTLRGTASRALSPDNDFGYGIVNARAAVTAFGPAFSNAPEVDASQSGVLGITVRILSRAGIDPASVRVHYAERNSNSFSTAALVQADSISYFGQIPKPATDSSYVKIYFTATDNSFGNVTYPKNAPQDFLLIRTDISTGPPDSRPTTFELQQNLPNPFRLSQVPATNITFALAAPAQVRLRVYNLLGQQVRELLNATRPVGRYAVTWDGRDDRGGLVSSGVYFYMLESPQETKMKKLLFLR